MQQIRVVCVMAVRFKKSFSRSDVPLLRETFLAVIFTISLLSPNVGVHVLGECALFARNTVYVYVEVPFTIYFSNVD